MGGTGGNVLESRPEFRCGLIVAEFCDPFLFLANVSLDAFAVPYDSPYTVLEWFQLAEFRLVPP